MVIGPLSVSRLHTNLEVLPKTQLAFARTAVAAAALAFSFSASAASLVEGFDVVPVAATGERLGGPAYRWGGRGPGPVPVIGVATTSVGNLYTGFRDVNQINNLLSGP